MKQREFTAKLGAWVREEQLARGGRKGRAGAVREGGRGAGSQVLRTAGLLTRSSTSTGSGLSAGGASGEAGTSRRLLGARDGGKERWAGLVGHIRARDCFFFFFFSMF